MAVGDLVVNLVTRTDRFSRGLNVARGQMSRFVSAVGSGISVLAKLGTVGAAAIGGISLKAVQLAADAEQTAIAFEVMTGRASIAAKLIQDLRTMGAKTPFEFGDLSDAGRTLMAFGRDSNDVMKDLAMLSDVASGNAQKLRSLALVYGQVAANARLTGGDLLQFVNTGFNPLQEIAQKTGETMAELRDRMSRGKIGFEEIREAFVSATSAGGRFFEMNEKQSKTLAGRWSTLKDEVTEAMIGIGKSIMDNLDLKEAIKQITTMANAFKNDLLPALGRALEQLPKLAKIMNEGFLGKEAGDQLEKIAFTIAAITQGIGPEEAGQMFAKIKKAEKEAPFTNQAQAIIDETQQALDEQQKFLKQRPIIDSLEQKGSQFMADQMFDGGFDRRTAAERFVQQFEETAKRTGKEIPEFIKEWLEEFKARQFATADKADQDRTAHLERQGGKFLAGLIRQGMEGVRSGVMSLGPVAKQEERFRNEVGVMEEGSAEAFETLLANVGPEQDKQLDVAKKSEQHLKKATQKLNEIAQALKKDPGTLVKVMGLD